MFPTLRLHTDRKEYRLHSAVVTLLEKRVQILIFNTKYQVLFNTVVDVKSHRFSSVARELGGVHLFHDAGLRYIRSVPASEPRR